MRGINRSETLKDFKKYPYVVDISGIFEHENPCDIWLTEKFGESDNDRWQFFFNYYEEPIFEKYADCGGIDFAMFADKKDMFEFMLIWK